MDYNIIISFGAQNDANSAYIFYETQQQGLGDRFLHELEHFYKKLKQNPAFYSFVSDDKTIRSLSLKIFPYEIIYEIEENEVFVFAVHHSRQNPDHFFKRL